MLRSYKKDKIHPIAIFLFIRQLMYGNDGIRFTVFVYVTQDR